jgi:hypothetical protein
MQKVAEFFMSLRAFDPRLSLFSGHSNGQLHRLRGAFLAAFGAKEMEIEASFCEAIRIAREQKSVSLAKRAEGTYVEYRRQKASASGGRGFRVPLC